MESKNLKILYIVNAALPNNRAHGIQIVNTCDGISKTGADLRLLTPFFFGSKQSFKEHYGIESKHKHIRVPSLDIPFTKYRHIIRTFSFFLFINVYVLLYLLLSLFSNKKLVLYVRGESVLALVPMSHLLPLYFETHQIRNHEDKYAKVLKSAKGVVTVTKRLKSEFVSNLGLDEEKVICARDSVDIEKYREVKPEKNLWKKYGIKEDKKIVLYTGSLWEEKGAYTLAESAKLLDKDVQVVFLGGSDFDIERFKEKYEDIKNISILGYLNHKEMPPHMAASDVLVLPDLATDTYSNLYTSPMKLFEYMASKRPIVSANVPSLMEVLSPQTALLFESGNSESLAEKIKEALADEVLCSKLSENAFEIVSQFTWEKRGEDIVSLIKKT